MTVHNIFNLFLILVMIIFVTTYFDRFERIEVISHYIFLAIMSGVLLYLCTRKPKGKDNDT